MRSLARKGRSWDATTAQLEVETDAFRGCRLGRLLSSESVLRFALRDVDPVKEVGKMGVFDEYGLRKVINARGPATVLGACRVKASIYRYIEGILDRAVDMRQLQALASQVISEYTGAEAGCVTGCSAAGIAIMVAALLTKDDLGKVARLPRKLGGADGIVIQKEQVISAGGCSVEQVVRLPGARLVEVGEAADCAPFHLLEALDDGIVGALFVYGSSRANGPGTIPLRRFASLCHEQGVPVIVDAAGATDVRPILDKGADLVVTSAHKWLGGPTAGFIAGRKDLIHACYLNGEFGIGRPMKAGKEAIAGLIGSLENWSDEAHGERRSRERAIVEHLVSLLEGEPGVSLRVIENTEDSHSACALRIYIHPTDAGLPAWEASKRMFQGDPAVAVDEYNAASGYLVVDPVFLDVGDEEVIAGRLKSVLAEARQSPSAGGFGEPPTRFEALTGHMKGWREDLPIPKRR